VARILYFATHEFFSEIRTVLKRIYCYRKPDLPNHLRGVTSSVTPLYTVTGNVSVQLLHHHANIKQINKHCTAGCIYVNFPIS
jgi:hypothetical protein